MSIITYSYHYYTVTRVHISHHCFILLYNFCNYGEFTEFIDHITARRSSMCARVIDGRY